MKTILLNTNLSKKEKPVAEYAAAMAKDFGASLTLIHVVEPQSAYLYFPDHAKVTDHSYTIENMQEEAKKQLHILVDYLNVKYYGSVKINTIIKTGMVTEAIHETAKSINSDMLLLAKDEDQNFLEKFAGTVNETIAMQVDMPVLIIPANSKYRPVKNILYATDYSDEDITTVRSLIKLVRENEPYIVAIHIVDKVNFEERAKEKGFLDTLKKMVNYENINIFHHPAEEIPEKLNELAKKFMSDWVVLLKENRGFFERIFTKSTTHKMYDIADIPLLIFHEK